MALSYTQITGDGTTRTFAFSFAGQDEGYLRESDIVVLVDGAESPYTLTSSNTLELSSAPANGAIVIIRRVMPVEQTFADFSRGNSFSPDTLNKSFLQSLYLIHEALDGFFLEGFKFLTEVKFAEGLDLEGQDINNVGKIDAKEFFFDGLRLEELLETISSASFSPISWHDQSVDVPISIPENKNAWSFGPEVSVNSEVTVGDGSYWTVAEGEKTNQGGDTSFDGTIDYGEI